MNIKPYLMFEGTATRSEYWGVTFISLAALVAVAFAATLFAGIIGDGGAAISGITIIIALIVAVWATVATTARRCRDAGINPWFTLLVFIPYVAIPACVVFGVLPTAVSKGE